MPPIHVLVKPVSSACNMCCTYCFYRDVSSRRERAVQGTMTMETAEKLLASLCEYAEGSCTIAFQGGEPTLVGLDFYKEFIRRERAYARPGLRFHHAIQTNGYDIDEMWAEFFAQNEFLVGLSLDGPPKLHNVNRKDRGGKGTCERILRTAQLFDTYKVAYNILCVLTRKNARSIQQIYQFFKRQGFRWLQFIPCLEPLGQQRGQESYHLSNQDYAQCLVTLFDLWYRDLKRGHDISIRHFDNWLSIFLGQEPEACSMRGYCSRQVVIEGDGSIYPCDFYATDEWRMGRVGERPLREVLESEKWTRFLELSRTLPEACGKCEYYFLCRNGCHRERTADGQAEDRGLYYYCPAHRHFFEKRGRNLYEAAQYIAVAERRRM